ncbi:Flp pilus assembly protein CpaB [Klebsiella sp. BIGb0407]|uniref:Flp pilus assembly protein CpaB n=1 Tax=Klebsiella sp. BIGb0407 TaxID=2940603 RepID=UPI002167B5E1|nr:Flp pilus assembly protein CpaB [Klebsiella sp. BIGb0407]MCS3430179.1 pilus assembly protein CpaB [Klebsiella sp. BIGb0407]
MKKKINSTILLSGACIFAAIVALFVRSQLSTPAPVQQQVQIPVPKKMVLVADKDLNPGDFIDIASVRWEETEKPVSRSFYFINGQDKESQLFGATVRKPVLAGTALNNSLVVRPNEPGFISAVLGKGMRAISIPTNAVASNSGLVNAGDRVDIILSLRKSDQQETSRPSNSAALPRLAAQTIVNDLRVLALNNDADSNADVRPRQDVDNPDNTNNSSRPRQALYQTVTVEVTPEQAEVLAVAKEIGLLHLSLRSGADSESEDQQAGRVTTLSDSTDIYNGVGSGYEVKLFRGEKKENKVFPAQ